MVQAAAPEGPHGLVEARADARDLRFGNPRVHPQRFDQVVHRAGGHAVDVGLHDHRVQGLVDAATRFEQRGHEAALAQLGDLQFHVSGPRGQQPPPVPVALGHPAGSALIAGRADRVGGLGLDQLLEHQAHRVAHQLRAPAGAESLPQLLCGRIRKGHRRVLLDE